MSDKNVHFRNLTAAHVDDDHGGCGQHSGPLRRGSPHVFVQNRPLVREKDLPSCAGRPDHEPAPHCHVGEGGGSAVTTARRGGVQSAPRKKCTAAGHPVDVATGRVFTHVAERGSPALPEFSWERFYSTEMAGESGPLGWGWAHSLAQRLEMGPDDLTYIDAEGRRVLFPGLELGESVQHLDEQVTLAQGNEGEYVLERPEGVSLFFEEDAKAGIARLQAVFDDAGRFLVLEYDAALLRRVTDSLGNVYRIDSEDGLHWSSISREATQEETAEEEAERCLARFQYDRAGHLSAAADALGEWWRYGYDHAHRLVQETNRSGFTFFFEYDGVGRCLRTHGQDGVYDLSFSYAEGRTTQRDAQGNTTAYEYNDLGLVTRVTNPEGHAEEFTYADMLQTARTDALGRTTAYAYDPEGRVTERTAPSGATDRMAYDGGGLASLSEPEGEPLTRTVTPKGQILVTAGSMPLLTLEADSEDGSVSAADGAGEKSRLYFDDAGRLVAAASPLGRTLETSHDSFGSVSALRDTAGRIVHFEYDAEGRLSAVDRESGSGDKGSGFRFGYDPEGNLEYFIDGNEGVTRFGTGGYNQLQSLTAPDGRTVRFEYDDAGRLCRLLDARQSAWQMDYDRTGRLARLLHPEGGAETFSYDPAGQVLRHTARSGTGKEYEYDADGSLTQISCDDGTGLRFTYDKNGRVAGASGPGTDVEFEYDGLGHITRETQNGQSVAYAYDAAGRLASIETPTGDKITHQYDADGMLTEATNWNGGKHCIVYGADGTMQSLHAPNGVSSRFEYSPLGLPVLVHLEREGEAAPLAQIRLRFDGNDALTEALDSALGRARFEYDLAGRLVQASGETRETFEYDPAGNLTRQGRQEYAYNAGSERLSTPEFACRHDADGNLVEEDTPAGPRRYAYNALGLLVQVEMPGGVRAEYAYDPFGRRYRKRVHQAGRSGRWTETRFVWAGDQLLSETTTNEAGAVLETRDFLFVPGSFTPLAQRVNGAAYCCHTDFRGAPTRLTDDAGEVAWAAAYSAYGEARPRKERLRQPLRLPGQYHDAETGLHQNRWRSFDPQMGRYLSPDPLGLAGGINLYAYAGQDPIGNTDPLGQLFSVAQIVSDHLGPQAAQTYLKVKQGFQSVLHPFSPPLPPRNPRPPEPVRSVVHPSRHLPPPPAHHTPAHRPPAHHAPPPAKAAAHCAPAPHAAAPHPAAPPKYSVVGFGKRVIGADGHQGSFHNFGEDIFGKGGPHGRMGAFGAVQTFFNHIGNSLGDGAVGLSDHFSGDTDHEKAVLDDAKKEDDTTRTMLKGTLGGDDGLAATGAQALADKIYAREYPAAAAELNKDAAGQMAKAKAGVIDQAYNDPFGDLAMVAPVGGAGRLAALGRLSKALEAANAAGDVGRAARIGKAMEALQGGKAGAALRDAQAQAVKKLSVKGQAIRDRGRMAVAKHQDRQAAGQRDPNDPLAPHTPASLAKAETDEAQMHTRWEKQGQHTGQRQALARAGEAPGSKHTKAIGQPGGKSGVMQMARQKGASKSNGVRSTSQVPRPARWRDKIPVGGNKAIHAALQSEVSGLRARIRAAGLVDDSRSTLNGNLAAAKVIMKDGTSKTFYSYSSMSKLSKPTRQIAVGLAKDPNLARMFVEDRVPHVQTKVDFGYPNHTEPRLLNYILSEHGVNDIAEVHLFTERPPCDGSCGPYVLQSWRNGQWQAVPWQPPQGSVVVPETQSIPLYVYDANGDRW